jgi:hypothetical protein
METAEQFNKMLAEWKQSQNPVQVKFIKKECTTVLVEHDGKVHRVDKNRLWHTGPVEESKIIEARLSDLNGDYLKN